MNDSRQSSFKQTITFYYLYNVFSNLVFHRGIFILFLGYKGLSGFEIGLLQATLFWSNLVTEVPAGVFGDRFGRRSSILAGLACMTFVGLGFLLFDHFYAFLCLFVLEGLGMSLISGSDISLLYDEVNAEKGKATFLSVMGKSYGISLYAIGIATLIGGFLQKISWNVVYASYSLSMMVAFLCIFMIHENRDYFEKAKADESADKSFNRQVISFFRTDRGRHVLMLMFVVATFDSAFLGYYMFGQRLFEYYHLDITHIALLYMISRFISATTFMASPKILEKLAPITAIYLCMFITSSLLFVNFFITSAPAAVAVFLLMIAFPYLLAAVMSNHIHQCIPSEIRASVVSVSNMVRSLVLSSFYLIIGYLVDLLLPNQALALLGFFPLGCMLFLAINRDIQAKIVKDYLQEPASSV
ncbi:MAG: MFS transporter [Ardenticatenales bacterium]|nr:MFS transporter [Ardenticatenales bacterium]